MSETPLASLPGAGCAASCAWTCGKGVSDIFADSETRGGPFGPVGSWAPQPTRPVFWGPRSLSGMISVLLFNLAQPPPMTYLLVAFVGNPLQNAYRSALAWVYFLYSCFGFGPEPSKTQ
eukprot:1658442-Alexandrium_andersonii.AAC.1